MNDPKTALATTGGAAATNASSKDLWKYAVGGAGIMGAILGLGGFLGKGHHMKCEKKDCKDYGDNKVELARICSARLCNVHAPAVQALPLVKEASKATRRYELNFQLSMAVLSGTAANSVISRTIVEGLVNDAREALEQRFAFEEKFWAEVDAWLAEPDPVVVTEPPPEAPPAEAPAP